MANPIFLASAEPETGKSAVALGLLSQLSRTLGRVGVFRPIVRHHDKPDYVLQTLIGHGGASTKHEDAAGVTYADVHHNQDESLTKILAKFYAVSADSDAVIIVGSDYTGVSHATELEFNARIAANIGAPMVLVMRGHREDQHMCDVLTVSVTEVEKEHAHVNAVVVNAADPDRLDEIRDVAQQCLRRHPVYRGRDRLPSVIVLPADPILGAPTMGELMVGINGRLISGDERLLSQEATGMLIAGMTLPHVLPRLYDNAAVVVPGDRFEIMLGVMVAHQARDFPDLSGLILNGGIDVDPQIGELIDGMYSRLPIISTEMDTYETGSALHSVKGKLTPDATRKVSRAIDLFEKHVDIQAEIDRLNLERPSVVTPLMFEHKLVSVAQRSATTIVLPEGTEPRILKAADEVLRRNIAELILLGDAQQICERAAEVGANIANARLLDPINSELTEQFMAEYQERRKHKQIPAEVAFDRMRDVSYFGTMLVLAGQADGMVSGAAHTTAHTIRPAIELLRDSEKVDTVSSSLFMCLPDKVLVYADCAIVPDPTDTQLADIAISSADTATAFGLAARVAMLSYSTGSSGSGTDVEKVRAATHMVRERRPDIVVEGPLQYDAAVDPGVAATKMPDSPVAGKATVLIFPDLNTGNNTYKAVQRSAGAVAVGPLLQGLKRPVNDLSRGATVEDIVGTVATTAVQAVNLRGEQA